MTTTPRHFFHASALLLCLPLSLLALDGMVLQTDRVMFNAGLLTLTYLSTGHKDTLHDGLVYGPSFSPDGRRVAYGDYLAGQLCVADIDGDNRSEISACPGLEPTVTWAGDGYIYFCYRDPNLYRVRPDGSERSIVFTSDNNMHAGSVSQDGLRAAWTKPTWSVAVADLATGTERSFGSGCQGTISPDGALVTHNTDSHTEAHLMRWEDGSVYRTISPPEHRFNLHRWAHHAQNYVCYTIEETNTGCIHNVATDEITEVGWGIAWDYFPEELQPGPSEPSIGLSSAAIDFVSTSGGMVSPSSEIVVVANRTAGTTLAPVHVSSPPPWLVVETVGTGNSQSLRHTINTAAISVDGAYVAEMLVSAEGARDSARYCVRLFVADTAMQAGIAVVPGSAALSPDSTLLFSAIAVDQYGNKLSSQPSMTWEATGGGIIDGSGTFTAGSVDGGPFEVRVMAGGDTGTATVSVVGRVLGEAVRVDRPGAGYARAQGDTLLVSWDADCSQVPGVKVELTLDDGEHWTAIENSGSLSCGRQTWQWVIPDSLQVLDARVSTASDRCRVRVANYLGQGEGLSALFSIYAADMGTRVDARDRTDSAWLRFAHTGRGAVVIASSTGRYRLQVVSLDGRVLASRSGRGTLVTALPDITCSGGTVVVRLTDLRAGATLTRLLIHP